MTAKTRAPQGGGSIYKITKTVVKPSGRAYTYDYYVAQSSFKDPNGKTAYVRGFGKTQAEALRRRQAKLTQRLAKGAITRTARSESLEAYFTQWIDQPTKKGQPRNVRTKLEHQTRYSNWIKPILTGPIASIKKEDIARVLNQPKLTKAGPSAKVNVNKTLKAILNGAVYDGIITANPMDQLRDPKAPALVNREDTAHADKRMNIAKGLLKWIADPTCSEHENYALICVMFLGLRRAETLGLTWNCIHQATSKHPQLEIKQQLHRIGGGAYHIESHAKTEAGFRLIYLTEPWKSALKEQKSKHRKSAEAWSKDLIFLKEDGSFTNYGDYGKIWKQVLTAYMTKGGREMTETDYWRPHSNRKITASLLADAGVQPQVAMTILGHNTEAMTHYYTTLSKRSQETGMDNYAREFTTPAKRRRKSATGATTSAKPAKTQSDSRQAEG